ncbi:hypothetical protein [Tropicimonas aquimaris]|uniref:Uncharacterized protein n=1 Tax=Tropicimonas aquimaris TaxID=914152 RepID=A0ABW3ISY6_9RHOB
MKAVPLIIAAVVSSGPSLAQTLQCQFTSECFDTEACAESAYEMTVRLEGDIARLSAVDGDFDGTAAALGDGNLIRFASGFGPAMLTIHGDAARFSTHGAADAMMVNYSGTCREVE